MYSENPDEMLAIAGLSGVNPRTLNFKLKCFQYGGGYLYPMGAMIAVGKIINGEPLNVSIEQIINNPNNIASMYIWGRALNLIALLVCFVGLYLIFYSQWVAKKTALFGSGIIMTSPAIFNWATVLKPHLFGVSFLILSVGVVLLGKKRKQLKKYYFIAMCLAGFASSAQYLMVGAGIIPCLLILQNRGFTKREKIKIVSIGILISGLTFFIFNPYHIFNINIVLNDLERAGSFYSPEFFNPKTPIFALWMWGIGTGFIAIPLVLGLISKYSIKSFLTKYNYFVISIILFGYYGSVMCISLGFRAVTARFFISMIILVTILFFLKIDTMKNIIFRKTIFCLLFLASLANILLMKNVLNEGKRQTRPYIEASKYLKSVYHKYDAVYSLDATPAPYKMPAFHVYSNIRTKSGNIKKNELLVSDTEIKEMKLIKSFTAKKRYFKMSFAEKNFFFYEK